MFESKKKKTSEVTNKDDVTKLIPKVPKHIRYPQPGRPGYVVPLKGKGSKLSPKMAIFVEEYFVDMNASQAVLRAGYKAKYPKVFAQELMTHPLVKEAIAKRLEERLEETKITQEYVLNKLVAIVDDTEKGNPQAALRGLELLGKHLGLYRDRQEISGPDGSAIELEQKKIQNDVSDFTSRLSRLAKRGGEGNVLKFPDGSGEG